MARRSPLRHRGAAPAALTALAAACTVCGPSSAQTVNDPAALEVVTVTAERRETLLLKTPESVTALSGEVLRLRGTAGLDDLNGSIPNYTFTSNQGVAQVFLRGIGNNFITLGGDPGVAFYADGAYVSDQTATNTGLFDVKRVEVLRGPQGALYGRNATGGAMNVISNSPTTTFSARLGAAAGSFGRAESEGFVSGPLGGTDTTARLSYQVKHLAGYTRNRLAAVAGAPDRLDDLSSQALRAQTLTPLPAGGRLRLLAQTFRQDDNGASSSTLPEAGPTPGSLLYRATPTGDPWNVKSQGAFNRRKVNSVQAILEQPIADADLSVNASYRKAAQGFRVDCDGTEALLCNQVFDTRSQEWTLDAHLASASDARLRWLVGATALRFRQAQDIVVDFAVPVGFLVPGGPLNVPFPGTFLQGGEVTSTAYAVYGDLRYAINSQWSAGLGLRHGTDRKSSTEYQTVAAFGINGRGNLRGDWDSAPTKLSLEGQLDKETLTYLQWSRGFKSGAINVGALQPQAVRPEKVASLEWGLKTSFLQRRGLLSASLFSADYSDLQVIQIVGVGTALQNAAKARINGMEVESLWRLNPALTASLNLAWLDGTYRQFKSVDQRHAPAGPAIDLAGNQLANTSRQQAAVALQYETAWPGAGRLAIRADYSWRSKIFFTEFNTEDASQRAYGLLNLSASLASSNNRWRVQAYVKNATNTVALASMTVVSPLLGATRTVNYVPPRMVGLGAELLF
ncbi:MAG: TonB-dependent receptor [Rubrivivax sp.]